MYEVYCAKSPNIYKVTICLGELGVEWRDIPLAVDHGEQHKPEFLALNPNGRAPVLIDHDPVDGGGPLTVWESGAILTYLAEKTGRFLPTDPRRRALVQTWLFWQMAGQGPMSGQRAHFVQYDPPGSDYALERYRIELHRLNHVLDRQLAGQDWIAGEYSIADMACFPWSRMIRPLGLSLDGLDNLAAWRARMLDRPAVQQAYERMDKLPLVTASKEERFAAMSPARGLAALQQP